MEEVCCLLAKRGGGEVISADSMCDYRGMDIGTAKPLDCMREVRHHLVDIVITGGVNLRSNFSPSVPSVSYTHLTLPTILRV